MPSTPRAAISIVSSSGAATDRRRLAPGRFLTTLTTLARQRKVGGVPRIHLIVGPVAAGKSTFALELSKQHRAVRLNLDEWMAQLFSPDRPDEGVMSWYTERTARCIEQIWRLTISIIEAGTDVILEIGLIQRRDRERLYRRVAARGYDLTIHVLDAPRELRRERVQQRNQDKGATFSMVVPEHIFELASDMWEPLEEDECSGRDVHFMFTDM
jgi:predicted kinase